jgi:hypothetical protein
MSSASCIILADVGSEDVQRLADVLALAREHRLALGAVVVGDIKLVVAGRLPEERAPSPDVVGALQETRSPEAVDREAKLTRLRLASKKQFGYVKPDKLLLELDGIL